MKSYEEIYGHSFFSEEGIQQGFGHAIEVDCLSARMIGLGVAMEEEKYTVTLICQNCGNDVIVQIPCGVTWDTVKYWPECDKCKIKKKAWDRA